MEFSKVAQSLSDSATLEINAIANSLKAKGEPLIHLGGGEPKGKAPNDAVIEAMQILSSGEVRYTPASGIAELKQSILKYTKKHYNKKIEQNNIIVTSGAKQAITVALQAILNPDDEVIFPVPYWVSYPEMVKLCNAIPIPVTPKKDIYHPDIEDIKSVITKKTKVIIINSPNNPTGAIYTSQFIEDVTKLCEERDIFLIMDDIYSRLVFDNIKPLSSYNFIKKDIDDSKLIIINGVSKQYAMTGFRIGWAIGSKEVISIMTKFVAHQTSGASIINEKAAIGALEGKHNNVKDLQKTLQKNRDLLVKLLKEIPNLKVEIPQGTFYSFIDFNYYEKDSKKLSKFFLEKIMVATIPGIAFGLDGYLRISFCGSQDDIKEGIKRVKWALDFSDKTPLKIGDKVVEKTWDSIE